MRHKEEDWVKQIIRIFLCFISKEIEKKIFQIKNFFFKCQIQNFQEREREKRKKIIEKYKMLYLEVEELYLK